MIPEDEFSRVIRSTRIAGTVMFLLLAVNACKAAASIRIHSDILENIVLSGRDPVPYVSRLFIDKELLFLALVTVITASGLLHVWRAKKLSRIVLVAGLSMAVLLLITLTVEASLLYGLHAVMSRRCC